MIRKTVFAALLAVVSPCSVSYAESQYERCQDVAAGIDPRMVACADQELARQNHALNEKYAQVLARIKRDEVATSFRDAERAWMIYRDRSCGFENAVHAGGSLGRLLFPECLIDLTRHRVSDMDGYLKDDELGAE